MPRQARIDAPGALHHIIARGIGRRKIFNDREDRNRFIERLSQLAAVHPGDRTPQRWQGHPLSERIDCFGSIGKTRALGQMALLKAHATDEQVRKEVRIGNVIIISGDISREEFGTTLADGLLRMAERTTIYVSSADSALVWARRLFRRERLGQMLTKDLPSRTSKFLQANPSLEFVDVTKAAGSTTGNGHSYFRNSPWVSSDLLALLAGNLNAVERGLEKKRIISFMRFRRTISSGCKRRCQKRIPIGSAFRVKQLIVGQGSTEGKGIQHRRVLCFTRATDVLLIIVS